MVIQVTGPVSCLLLFYRILRLTGIAHLSLEMYYAPFWAQGSTEALCRTPVDLFLFDRLAANQEAAAARRVTLQTGVMITADNTTQDLVVSGECDYVLGYPHAEGSGETSLESSTVIVEAKTPGTLAGGLAQCACYLGMLSAQKKIRDVFTVVNSRTSTTAQWEARENRLWGGHRWTLLGVSPVGCSGESDCQSPTGRASRRF